MKTLYLDCGMGAAGDMLTAALLELLPEPKAFLQELNALGIPGVVTTAVRTEKCGICGTQLSVTVNGAEEESEDVPLAHTHACSHVHEHDHEHEHAHEHPHSHTGIADIRARIAALPVPQRVRDNILAVYGRLAAAESEAHGRPVDQIHFHEVGTLDALVCNPPYVTSEEMTRLEPSVKEYEPALALDGGKDGLAFYRAVAENFTHLLSDGGYLCFEFGLGQHMAVSMILQEYGYTDIVLRKDLRGVVRAVRGKKK